MRLDRVLKQYKPVLDYREKETVYKQIINDYSVVTISASDFTALMELKWNVKSLGQEKVFVPVTISLLENALKIDSATDSTPYLSSCIAIAFAILSPGSELSFFINDVVC